MSRRASAALRSRRDTGATAIEYALMMAAVAVIITAVVFSFGQVVRGTFQDASDCFAAQDQSPQPYPDCTPPPVDNP